MKCWKGKSRVSPNSARLSRSTGGRSGLVHISEVANTYVSDVNEYLKVGQTVKVKVIGISDEGRINLSISARLSRRSRRAPRAAGTRSRSAKNLRVRRCLLRHRRAGTWTLRTDSRSSCRSLTAGSPTTACTPSTASAPAGNKYGKNDCTIRYSHFFTYRQP